MPPPPSTEKPNYDLLIFVLFLFALIMGIGMMYEKWRIPINTVLMAFNHSILELVAWLSVWTGLKVEDAARINRTWLWNYPQLYTWHDMVALFSASGQYLRWFLLPCGIAGALHAYNKLGIGRFSTIYSMQRLIEANIPSFPCMAPVHNRKLTMQPESMDHGRWKTARTSLQFAVENKILLTFDSLQPYEAKEFIDPQTGIAREFIDINSVSLDRTKLTDLFQDQVKYGGHFEGKHKINHLLQSNRHHFFLLAAAFTAHACGNRQAAQTLLDTISLGFFRKTRMLRAGFTWAEFSYRKTKPPVLKAWWECIPIINWMISKQDTRDENQWWRAHHISLNTAAFLQADAIFTQYVDRPEVQTAMNRQWNITWLMALLLAARKKGVLACSQFIWLRAYDRRLWYALNQLGGKRAWIEATGAWVQFYQEVEGHENGTGCAMDGAIQDFINEMASIGIEISGSRYSRET